MTEKFNATRNQSTRVALHVKCRGCELDRRCDDTAEHFKFQQEINAHVRETGHVVDVKVDQDLVVEGYQLEGSGLVSRLAKPQVAYLGMPSRPTLNGGTSNRLVLRGLQCLVFACLFGAAALWLAARPGTLGFSIFALFVAAALFAVVGFGLAGLLMLKGQMRVMWKDPDDEQ